MGRKSSFPADALVKMITTYFEVKSVKPYITGCLVTIATVLISYFYIRNGIELDVITGLTWGLYSGITHYLRREHKPKSTKIQVAWPTFLVLIVVSSVHSLNLLNDK